MSEALRELGAHIEAKRTDCVLSWDVAFGELTMDVALRNFLAASGWALAEACEGRDGLLLDCPAALQYRWMVEEFRVSLFAQHLGTRQAVSEKRLRQQWNEVERWLLQNPQ